MISQYKKEAYSPGVVKDPLYYYDSKAVKYQPMDVMVYESIINKGYYNEELD